MESLFPSPYFRGLILVTALGFMALEYGLGRLVHATRRMIGGRVQRPWASRSCRTSSAWSRPAWSPYRSRSSISIVCSTSPRQARRPCSGCFSAASSFITGSTAPRTGSAGCGQRIRSHDSPTKLNLTAAIRLGWTGNISGNFLFFLPLVWIGFHPFAVVTMLGINLTYQFLIHTELAPRLGPLEFVLNTPAHHRVHHASNEACLERNYGGMLIIFDRLVRHFRTAPSGRAAALWPGRGVGT